MSEGLVTVRRALVSVSDKTGLIEFARFLAERQVEILSTGGSAKALRDAGLVVKEVAEHTGFPEVMDGRVKTLHPKIHGGILARRDEPQHLAAMRDHGIAPIDLVVINLYPFEATARQLQDKEPSYNNLGRGCRLGPSRRVRRHRGCHRQARELYGVALGSTQRAAPPGKPRTRARFPASSHLSPARKLRRDDRLRRPPPQSSPCKFPAQRTSYLVPRLLSHA